MHASHPVRRIMFIAVALVLLAPGLGAAVPEADAPGDCVEWVFIAGQGPSCPVPGGWRVKLPDGATVLTHGPDDVALASDAYDPVAAQAYEDAARPPVCARDLATEARGVVIYARPASGTDNYEAYAPRIRDLVESANGILRRDAAEQGALANYVMRCDDAGRVKVENAVLDINSATAGFWTLVGALRDLGYDNRLEKYWIWYDGSVDCGCSGQGTVHSDSRASPDNRNNRGPDYGITYGYWSVRTMMHENGHNNGAVQLNAPHSSGGWHCNDGRDIMCYADGGSKSDYSGRVCTSPQRFDCNRDDYFNTDPEPGSYLDTHWNLGDPVNRFITFGNHRAPLITRADCTPVPAAPGETVTCTLDANDEGSHVAYHVDWGDGSPVERVPAEGHALVGVPVDVTHAYNETGDYRVTVTAVDAAETPHESAPVPVDVPVHCDCEANAAGVLVDGAAAALLARVDVAPASARPEAAPEDAARVDVAAPAAAGVVGGAESGARTESGVDASRAEATARVGWVNLAGGLVQARGLEAVAVSDTAAGEPVATASFEEVWIAGQRFSPDVAPNTRVPLPGVGYAVLNEVVRDGGEVTATALRLVLEGPAGPTHVRLATAHAAADCDAVVGRLAPRAADNDGASGGDAGDHPDEGLPVRAPATLTGRMGAGDPADHYVVHAVPGERVEAVLLPAQEVPVTVRDVAAPAAPEPAPAAFELSLLEPETFRVREQLVGSLDELPRRVSLNVDVPGAWVLAVTRVSEEVSYTLRVDLRPVALRAQDDAGRGGDAGDACAAATPVGSGVHAGVLLADDPSDWYRVEAPNRGALVPLLKPGESPDGADFDLFVYDERCRMLALSVLGKGIVPKGVPDSTGLRFMNPGDVLVFEVRRVSGVGNYLLDVGVQA